MWLDDEIEVLRPDMRRGCFRFVLFDFDGTLSLIRSGWMDVMIPMMTGILAELNTGETEAGLRNVVEDDVGRLTGQETVYQMIALADAVRARGGLKRYSSHAANFGEVGLQLVHELQCSLYG